MRTLLIVARTAVLALVLLLPTAPSAIAAPGALDERYGAGGILRAGTPGQISLGMSAERQADGSVLLSGTQTSIALDDFELSGLDLRLVPTVTRYRPDGSLDPAFGTAGTAKVYLQNHVTVGVHATAQPDGKVVVTGATLGLFSASTFVARLDGSGRLDPTFGRGGFVTVLPESVNALVPVGVHVLADGTIVVPATAFSGDLLTLGLRKRRKADFDVALVRLLPDGTPDTAAGSDGIARWSHGTASMDLALTSELTAGGKILIGGFTLGDAVESASALIARFDPTGSIDSTYGDAGVATQPSGRTDFEAVLALHERQDGSVAAVVVRLAGDEDDEIAPAAYVRRVNAAGQGIRFAGSVRGARLPAGFMPGSLYTYPDGRTVVGGTGSWSGGIMSAGSSSASVVRLTAAGGVPDLSFERRGTAHIGAERNETRFSAASDVIPDESTGQILVGGTFNGVSGLSRLYGDDPAGAGTGRPGLSVRVAGRGAKRGCGNTRRRACVLRPGRKGGPARLIVRTAGGSLAGREVVVQVDRNYWGWNSQRQYRLRLGSRGGARIGLGLAGRRPGLYRLRVRLPATATTRSAGRLIYVSVPTRVRRRSGDSGLYMSGYVATAYSEPRFCSGGSRSARAVRKLRGTVLYADARASCKVVNADRRRGMSARRTIRRFLGR